MSFFYAEKKREIPTPGIEPGPPAWKAEILTTRPRRIHWIYVYILVRLGYSGTLIETTSSSSSALVELWETFFGLLSLEFKETRDDEWVGRGIRWTISRRLSIDTLKCFREDFDEDIFDKVSFDSPRTEFNGYKELQRERENLRVDELDKCLTFGFPLFIFCFSISIFSWLKFVSFCSTGRLNRELVILFDCFVNDIVSGRSSKRCLTNFNFASSVAFWRAILFTFINLELALVEPLLFPERSVSFESESELENVEAIWISTIRKWKSNQ